MNFVVAGTGKMMLRLILVLVLLSCPPWAQADNLGDFEHSAAKPHPQEKGNSNDDAADQHDFWSDLVEGFFRALFSSAGASSSTAHDDGYQPYSRTRDQPVEVYGMGVDVPAPQDPRLQTPLRIDLAGQQLHDHINALDLRVEAGVSALGVQLRSSTFHDRRLGDTLNYTQLFAMVRLPTGKMSEAGLGFGPVWLAGHNSNNGAGLLLYNNIGLTEHAGLRLRYSLSTMEGNNTLRDADGAFEYSAGRYAVDAGYRQLRVGGASLSGPYVGFALRY
jgi:hypothetical protein